MTAFALRSSQICGDEIGCDDFLVLELEAAFERRAWVYILVTKKARKQARRRGKERSYGGSFGFGWPGADGMLVCDKQQEDSGGVLFCGTLRQLLGLFGASLQCESLCFWKAPESSGPAKLLHFAVHGFEFLGRRRYVQVLFCLGCRTDFSLQLSSPKIFKGVVPFRINPSVLGTLTQEF